MFGGEECHRVRHILRAAGPARRDAFGHFGADGFRQSGGHIGLNKAGRNGIHRDVPAGQLPRQTLGQADEAGLAGGIVGLAGIAPQRHNAGKVHDAAIALAHHAAGGFLTAEESTLEVGVQHGVKVLFGQAEDEVVAGDARVVHQDIHPAKGGRGGVKQRLAACGGGNIGLHGHGVCACGFAQRDGLGRSGFAVAVVDHHVHALFCQCGADGAADAAAPAGQSLFAHTVSFFHASSTASSSSGVSTAAHSTPGRVFFTKPLRALPGPTSRMWSTPSSPRRRRVSSM